MATAVLLPSGLIGPGTFTFGPVTIPAGITSVQVAASRTSVLSTTATLAWRVALAADGTTFQPWIGLATIGGALTNPKTLASIISDVLHITVPIATDGLGKLQGDLTVNEALTTALTLTMI